jgi:malate/lactate dehydrogenase
VQGYTADGLADALRGCDVVIIPAGVPRKPGMTRDDLFKVQGGCCRDRHSLLQPTAFAIHAGFCSLVTTLNLLPMLSCRSTLASSGT